jgi:hypothetical protein
VVTGPVRALLGLGAAAVALGGCGSSTGPELLLDVATAGRVERSATAEVQVSFQGTPLDDALVQITAEPDTAVEFLSGTQLRFLTAGSVTLTAEAEVEPGRIEQGQLTLDVPAPPRIVFDMLRAGNRDIYGVALDGLDTVRLTT